MAVGFRVFSGGAKVDIDVVNRFRNLPVANVSESLSRGADFALSRRALATTS
jgi:hypothetical protein